MQHEFRRDFVRSAEAEGADVGVGGRRPDSAEAERFEQHQQQPQLRLGVAEVRHGRARVQLTGFPQRELFRASYQCDDKPQRVDECKPGCGEINGEEWCFV